MFKPLPEADAAAAPIDVTIDGAPFRARDCDTAASALLLAGVVVFRRTAATATPRAPYCMMGACFDCRVTIDGVRDLRACCVRVYPGMSIETREKRD